MVEILAGKNEFRLEREYGFKKFLEMYLEVFLHKTSHGTWTDTWFLENLYKNRRNHLVWSWAWNLSQPWNSDAGTDKTALLVAQSLALDVPSITLECRAVPPHQEPYINGTDHGLQSSKQDSCCNSSSVWYWLGKVMVLMQVCLQFWS